MVYITQRYPSGYWRRHPDWYQGVFRDVVHAIGLIGNALFWLDQEGKCASVDALIPEWPVIGVLDDIFIKIYRDHYNRKHVSVYDEWALQGCKFFEKVEGEINKIPSMIKGKVDEAQAYIETNLINPIRDKINREIVPIVNDVQNRIKTAEADVRRVQDGINDAVRDLEKHTGDIRELFDRVKELEGTTRTQASSLDWLKTKLEVAL